MSEIAELRRENAELRQRCASLTATIDDLTQQVAQLNERIAELLAAAQRRQRNSPKGPPEGKNSAHTNDAASSSEPSPASTEVPAALKDRPSPPVLPERPSKSEKKQKPTGRKSLPQHLEAETTTLRPETCAACGGVALDVADEVVEEKLHVVKEHQRRRVVRRTTCRCRACGERTTPRSLPAPYDRSKITCEWLAWFIHQKFALLAPLDRIRRDLADRDIVLPMSTLVGFVERAADLLAGVDGVHWQQLLRARWMATDSTGLKVLVPELPAAHNGYIEQYRNNDAVVFQYEPTKDGDVVESKLAPFAGVLTADAEHRFNGVFKNDKVKEAGCNAHGRRKFRDAEATQPVLAVEGGTFIAAMYAEENAAQKRGLVGDALLLHRQTHIRPIADRFDEWLNVVDGVLLPKDPLKAAVRYYQKHREALYRFIDDADVPIDNSPTEREFQNIAKLRLNMLFAGSTEGAHRACVLLGIVASCRAVGVPIQAYLAWAFERLGTHRDVFNMAAVELTPLAFKKTLVQ